MFAHAEFELAASTEGYFQSYGKDQVMNIRLHHRGQESMSNSTWKGGINMITDLQLPTPRVPTSNTHRAIPDRNTLVDHHQSYGVFLASHHHTVHDTA